MPTKVIRMGIMIHNPYELTEEEFEIIERLKNSFMHSEKLNKHVNFLYSKGHIYQNFNDNVLFHGCIPMDEDGEFDNVEIMGKVLKGKELLDHIEKVAHKAYFGKDEEAIDLMWYFWCGPKSPLFGKTKAATFERYFLEEKSTHKEEKNPYYKYIHNEEICIKMLENFGVDVEEGHIINGHVPVKAKDGESPIRAGGKLIIIDGGFAKSYQPTTGMAGYTLTYNSNGLVLAANEPFESKCKAINEGLDIKSQTILKENVISRKRVADTDIGKKLQEEIMDLKRLLSVYREGILKEKI
jgi:fructose-1,6-bisphosphatase-3